MKSGSHKWAFVGDLAISFTTGEQLPDRDWDDFINDLKTKSVGKYLATNIGSIEVSSLQRKKFTDLSKVKPFPVAVVTDEKLVRGLVTAISWVGVKVKAFSWTELRPAVQHLNVPQPHEAEVIDAVRNLMLKAGSPADFRRLTGL